MILALPADNPSSDDLRAARLAAGLSVREAATWCGVTRATWRRQEHGQARVHLASYRLLLVLAGALPWPAWRGWVHRAGELLAPGTTREGHTPGHLVFAYVAREQVRELRHQVARLTARATAAEAHQAEARKARGTRSRARPPARRAR